MTAVSFEIRPSFLAPRNSASKGKDSARRDRALRGRPPSSLLVWVAKVGCSGDHGWHSAGASIPIGRINNDNASESTVVIWTAVSLLSSETGSDSKRN